MELEIDTWRQECQSDPDYQVDPDILQKYIDKNDLEIQGLDKHFRCMLTKMDIMNQRGEINSKIFRKRMSEVFEDEAVLDKIVNECAQVQEVPEETALFIRKCTQKFRDDN